LLQVHRLSSSLRRYVWVSMSLGVPLSRVVLLFLGAPCSLHSFISCSGALSSLHTFDFKPLHFQSNLFISSLYVVRALLSLYGVRAFPYLSSLYVVRALLSLYGVRAFPYLSCLYGVEHLSLQTYLKFLSTPDALGAVSTFALQIHLGLGDVYLSCLLQTHLEPFLPSHSRFTWGLATCIFLVYSRRTWSRFVLDFRRT